MWQRASYVLAGLGLVACAATASSTSSRPLISHTGREVLTAAEIVAARATDVYQAVAHLRPEFLRRRAANLTRGQTPIAVYLDDLPFGTVESLRQIPLDQVRLIRYLNPLDADLRWGGRHPSGAILVTTLRR